MFGFSPMETFDSKKDAHFGLNNFTGAGLALHWGTLHYSVEKHHNIIDQNTSDASEEIVVILTISNYGTKKEIRFLCDGKETATSDVSLHLNGDRLYPAICLGSENQQITTIPIDQLKIRTPKTDELIKEYHQQQQQQKQRFISISLQQTISLQRVLLHQQEIFIRAMIAKMKFEMKQ